MNPTEARAALTEVEQAKGRLAADYDYSFSRHLAFGALMGLLVASPALGTPRSVIVLPFVMLGVILVQRWDRARTGTFLNGWRAGRTLPISLIAVLGNVVLLLIGARYAQQGLTWVPLALALVATAFGVAISYAWQRVYLRELRVQGR
jgi:hypothetical protein